MSERNNPEVEEFITLIDGYLNTLSTEYFHTLQKSLIDIAPKLKDEIDLCYFFSMLSRTLVKINFNYVKEYTGLPDEKINTLFKKVCFGLKSNSKVKDD
jgi:hypothetical protein